MMLRKGLTDVAPDWTLLVEHDDGYFWIWDPPVDGDDSILEIGYLEQPAGDITTSQDHHPKPCSLSLCHPVLNRYHRLHWTSKLGGGSNPVEKVQAVVC
jgi:hypothetical protein